ncbi:MAG: transcriptional repressor [Tannerella sp.]|jgi:Fur family peroxide stress response transcriptional regulator|nr:transcriptional repressor [Tannerella sp.]
MNNISQYLLGYGIRPSIQRIAIMRYLTNNRTHPTVDEIFEVMRKQIPTLSKTTVYNTLKLFVEQGAAIYIGIDEKSGRFDGCVTPHGHFRCKKCGKIIDLDMEINNLLPENFHGTIDEADFYIKGTCEDCIVKNN